MVKAKSLKDLEFEKDKGASDLLAYYVHRPLENKIVLYLMGTRITPNQITILTNIVAYIVAAFYFSGLLLPGSILSFAVGLMDGLDGKLARAKNQTTKLGKMEHAFDLLFEFSWLIALAFFLHRSSGEASPLILCLLSILFISFYRYCYDTFSKSMNMSLDIYGSFEKGFRRIAGRRNLYNIHILIGVLFGFPSYSLISITVHAALTAIVYAWRTAKHLHAADERRKFPSGKRHL
ncbi:MAG: CDP-alcohol phosphatidyltransferase family protein [Candidatus Bathyarchaeota archaeon]|nr:CDP-alcohol phosphatidyltransferase family protein [Candidatus Bathyarchaeota archaeon]MDH5686307.1 CDP-alcohol phosphatidyltransferase family protein [Candidatus Bathyarchaeota archaeon]